MKLARSPPKFAMLLVASVKMETTEPRLWYSVKKMDLKTSRMELMRELRESRMDDIVA